MKIIIILLIQDIFPNINELFFVIRFYNFITFGLYLFEIINIFLYFILNFFKFI